MGRRWGWFRLHVFVLVLCVVREHIFMFTCGFSMNHLMRHIISYETTNRPTTIRMAARWLLQSTQLPYRLPYQMIRALRHSRATHTRAQTHTHMHYMPCSRVERRCPRWWRRMIVTIVCTRQRYAFKIDFITLSFDAASAHSQCSYALFNRRTVCDDVAKCKWASVCVLCIEHRMCWRETKRKHYLRSWKNESIANAGDVGTEIQPADTRAQKGINAAKNMLVKLVRMVRYNVSGTCCENISGRSTATHRRTQKKQEEYENAIRIVLILLLSRKQHRKKSRSRWDNCKNVNTKWR